MNPFIKKSLIASSVALALGLPAAANASLAINPYSTGAMTTDSANFTMLDPYGFVVGGTNDVLMTWDGNAYTASSDYTGPGSGANVTAASTTAFFSNTWTAHDIQVFTPGSYTFDTTLGGGNPETGIMSLTVGASQVGMHMLFDWNNNFNIDVVVAADFGAVFGAGIGNTANPTCNSGPGNALANCLYDAPAYGSAGMPNAANPFMLASSDADGDGVNGTPMAAGGPFQYFNANFNANMSPVVSAVPVPAAAWLFGSGLMGLAAIARRKKKA